MVLDGFFFRREYAVGKKILRVSYPIININEKCSIKKKGSSYTVYIPHIHYEKLNFIFWVIYTFEDGA